MPPTLEVFHRGQRIFSSGGRWLHPLFELETFLKTSRHPAMVLEVRDKIVGAASAFLVAHLDIRTLHAGVLSEQGRTVLERFGITVTFDTLVPRISCATETLLEPGMPVAEAIALLRRRAQNVAGGTPNRDDHPTDRPASGNTTA